MGKEALGCYFWLSCQFVVDCRLGSLRAYSVSKDSFSSFFGALTRVSFANNSAKAPIRQTTPPIKMDWIPR